MNQDKRLERSHGELDSDPVTAERKPELMQTWNNNGPIGLINCLARYLFGSFNGIQVFLYPGLLLYWLRSDRLVEVISDLLGLRIHYFPLGVFLLLGLYVAFILLKYRAMSSAKPSQPGGELATFVVDLHVKLLTVLLCFALLFVFAAFTRYFYGIQVPVKLIASWTARALGGVMILYYYLADTWLSPWLNRGHKRQAAVSRTKVYARRHPKTYVAFNLFQIVMVLALARIYVNLVEYIYHPILTLLGSALRLEFELKPILIDGHLALWWNALLTALAFLISNLGFIPLVWLAKLATDITHPIRPPKIYPHTAEN